MLIEHLRAAEHESEIQALAAALIDEALHLVLEDVRRVVAIPGGHSDVVAPNACTA
jgi:hypothetical protein